MRPTLYDAHRQRGLMLSRLSRHWEAVDDWDATLQLDHGPFRNAHRLQRALSLARLGYCRQAVAEADQLAKPYSTPDGESPFYDFARVEALAAGAVLDDEGLASVDREQLTKSYAAAALTILAKARAAGFFQSAARRDLLKSDPNRKALRSWSDFLEFLRELGNAFDRGTDNRKELD